MPNSSTEAAPFLRDLLLRLVEILRERGGPTWRLLVRVCRGRSAIVEVDTLRLRISARKRRPFRIEIETDFDDPSPPLFRSRGSVFLAILEGKCTLERALVDGEIYVCAVLEDLIGIHGLVMNILADSPRSAALRELWHEWKCGWPYLEPPTLPFALEHQHAIHGQLVAAIPLSLRPSP